MRAAATSNGTSRLLHAFSVPWGVWLWAAVVAVVYAAVSLTRLFNYTQPAFDLAIYEQTNWLLGRGGGFNTVAGIHPFGAHLSFVLVLTAPLSHLPGGPVPELVFQGMWLAMGVIPAYVLGRTAAQGVGFAIVYALHPAVIAGVSFGWRGWNLALPVVMLLAAAIALRMDTRWLVAIVAFLLLFREDMGVWVVLLIAIGWQRGWLSRRVTMGLGAVAVTWSAVATLVVLPLFSPVAEYLYEDAFSIADGSIHSHAVSLMLYKVVYILLPFAIAPVVAAWRYAWTMLIPLTGLYLGERVLTNLHYEMLFIPLLLMAIVAAGARWFRAPAVAAACLLSLMTIGPFGAIGWSFLGPIQTPSEAAAELRAVDDWLRDRVDSETTLALPNLLVAHYADRRQITAFPYPFDDPYAEPYAMDCPAPDFVVTDDSLTADTSGWAAASIGYLEEASFGAFTVYRRLAPVEDGPCRPAGLAAGEA